MALNRRQFLAYSAGSLAMLGTPRVTVGQSPPPVPSDKGWFMPDESHRHRRTWMAWGAHPELWDDWLGAIRDDLVRVANTIARYEPVSMLVRPDERKLAAKFFNKRIQLVEAAMDDLWIRDTGPTFVLNRGGRLGGVDLNFNGWGGKQRHQHDAKLARFVTKQAGATYISTKLVGEGGGLEVDGRGTAIITESCILNDNRNPGMSKEDGEALLKTLFGLRKIIWLPGIRGQDITDGHTDFYARFARPGVVVAALETDRRYFDYEVTREHLKILKASRDADGRELEIVTLETPRTIRPKYETEDFAAGYVNYYIVNGAVIAPEFGDRKADAKCKQVLQKLFPRREVVQLNIDVIAAGGGGIHCVTQQEPASTASL